MPKFELVCKSVQAIDKKKNDGTIKNYTNYYLVGENGKYIPIKPSFDNDYKVLYVLATKVDSI